MRASVWIAALLALVAAMLLAIALGSAALPLPAVARALGGVGDPMTLSIVRDLRLPRVVLAALVGAGLGVSGGALQGSLRNALAEPYLLGVSGGAAVGAILVTLVGVASPVGTPIGAFAGAVGAALTVLGVARAVGGRADPRILVMAGVVVGAFANAVVMVLLADAPADQVRNALWWMMGSAADARWSVVASLGAYLVVGAAILFASARDIDALALGGEPAAALGVDIDRVGRRVFFAASLVAAATVSAAGLVGFVGLVVPHIARACGARTHRALLPASALFGAALVVAADLAARTLRRPAELPLGAVTALVGVPFFLWRLRAAR
jgi:iron complex transport system permease protein